MRGAGIIVAVEILLHIGGPVQAQGVTKLSPRTIAEVDVYGQDGEVYRSYLKLRKQKVLTVVLNTEHEARYSQVAEKRWEGKSYSTKITEVEKTDTLTKKSCPLVRIEAFSGACIPMGDWRKQRTECS